MRIADLPTPRLARRNLSGVLIEPPQPVLWCPACGDTFSANPGDYSDRDLDDVLSCNDCGALFVLAETRTVHVPYDAVGECVAVLHVCLQALWHEHGVRS